MQEAYHDQQPVNHLVGHLFRHESARLVAALTRMFGLDQLELAQDIVQDTLLQAMQTWRYGTLPDNPSAWLYRVARNRAIDHLRREKKFRQLGPDYGYLFQQDSLSVQENPVPETAMQDSLLRMMFACCHPAIPEEGQIALVLKTLCGLSIAEIAAAFLSNEETISKRIYRAREKFRTEHIVLSVPAPDALPERLDSVLRSIYLLFNEGYHSSQARRLIRADFCEEAIRLALLLTQHKPTARPRTFALLALMHFQSSRLDTRIDDNGQIVLLKYQDRSRWNRELIRKGFEFLELAAEPFETSPYHFEAGIASLHAAAHSFEQTDWKSIYQLYDMLYRYYPNPVVALNKAIASSYAISSDKALEELRSISGLEKNPIYYTSFGDILFEQQKYAEAKAWFEEAMKWTNSEWEKGLLKEKLGKCVD